MGKAPKNSDIDDLFNHWNKEHIIVHKVLDKQMRKVIQSVIDDGYEIVDLKEAITNYAKALKGDEYTWTYKWRIEEFFKRTPGFRHFLPDPDEDPLKKFLRAGNSFGTGDTTPPVSPVSPALKVDFLNKKKKLLGSQQNNDQD